MTIKAVTQSVDANIIIAFLTKIPVGGTATVADIEKATGLKLKAGLSASAIKTARTAMENQTQVMFKVISGALYRLSDEDKIAEAMRCGSDANKRQNRAAKIATSVDDYNALTVESKDQHTRILTATMTINAISENSVMNKLVAMVKARGGSGKVNGRDIAALLPSVAA